MRMIGIGLTAFILAGAAFLLSYMNIWQQGWRQVNEAISGPQLVFESGVMDTPSQGAAEATFERSGQKGIILLSGLPAYQGASFPMPIDARPTSGHLQIDTTFQVPQGVEGALRVSINNQRRAEVLLRPGEAAKSLQIPLTSEELAGEQLVVSFSMQGRGPHNPCGSDDGIEAIAEIETTSGLYLTLDRPVESSRDRVATWGNNIHVAWPAWLSAGERSRRLVLAADLIYTGHQITFLGGPEADALTTIQLREVVGSANRASAPTNDQATWPVSLTLNSANSGVRRFARETSWRYNYNILEIAGHELASQLDLSLALGPLPVGEEWTVTATLNGRLVYVDTVAGNTMSYAHNIDLPDDLQSEQNTVEITATSSFNPQGICNDGPGLIAELRPETKLRGGGSPYSNQLIVLQNRVREIKSLGIKVGPEVTAPEATKAAILIADISTADTTLRVQEGTATVTVLNRAATAALLITPNNQYERWLVYTDMKTNRLNATRIDGLDRSLNTSSAPVALLVEFPLQGVEAGAN